MEQVVSQKESIFSKTLSILFVILGGAIAGYGLESVLLPNNLSDGGVTGISIMMSKITGISLSIFIVVFNLPFLYLGYKQIGKTFAIRSLLGIISLAISTKVMHHVPTIIDGDSFLVIIVGGGLLGLGMGIALRNGGALDGTDMLAVLISKKIPFSVSDVIIGINVVIFSFAILVFGFEGALASMISYVIATKVINVIEIGLSESKEVRIITHEPKLLGEMIQKRLGRGVTYYSAYGGFSKEPITVISCVINRMEENKIKTIIKEHDKGAFVTLNDVSEVNGGSFKKKDIH